MVRRDNPDFVYLTQKDKFEAIVEEDAIEQGRVAFNFDPERDARREVERNRH